MTTVTIPLPDTSLAPPDSYVQVTFDNGAVTVYTTEVGGPPGGDTGVTYDPNVTKAYVVNTVNMLVQLLTKM